MFDLLEAKRVRRDELYSDRSQSPSGSEPTTSLRSSPTPIAATQANKLEFETFDAHDDPPNPEYPNEVATDPQTFSFRLFSTPTTAATTHTHDQETSHTTHSRITIRSPTPADPTTSGFLVPYRPLSYYFTVSPYTTLTESTPEDLQRKRLEYDISAISTPRLLHLAGNTTPWHGCKLPWRVITTTTTTNTIENSTLLQQSTTSPAQGQKSPSDNHSRRRKTHPNKKRRIILRKKLATAVQAAETEKEKRARRNREKKVKRKGREKAKKKLERREVGSC